MHAIFFNEPIENNYIGHILAEVYKDRVYAPYLEGKKDLTIVDIGGNVGITSYYFSQFAKQVYTVEPSAEHFDVMTRMLAFNKIENVKPINKALWIRDEKLPLWHNSNKTMYSLHTAVNDGTSKEEEIEAITIETLFTNEGIEHVDLLKLDVEGSEFQILAHPTFKSVAPKIDRIIVERHAWAGRMPNQLVESLKAAGFVNVETIPNNADLLVATK